MPSSLETFNAIQKWFSKWLYVVWLLDVMYYCGHSYSTMTHRTKMSQMHHKTVHCSLSHIFMFICSLKNCLQVNTNFCYWHSICGWVIPVQTCFVFPWITSSSVGGRIVSLHNRKWVEVRWDIGSGAWWVCLAREYRKIFRFIGTCCN